MQTLPDELAELFEARECKNSRIFQKFFAKPIMERYEKLSRSYEAETPEQLARLKGRAEEMKHFIGLMKEVDTEIKIKEEQLNIEAGE